MPVTQEQLDHAVDQQFFQQHPDAPRKLDPHEPTHQHYVAEQQRHSTDSPEGIPRKFEVWVGLPAVTE
jgi:hypothetical protein